MHARAIACGLGLALTATTAALAQTGTTTGSGGAGSTGGGAAGTGAPAGSGAQGVRSTTTTTTQPPAAAPSITPTFSWRTRAEHWEWFDAPDADGRYNISGTLIRAGLTGRRPGLSWTVEAAAPILLGLPDDAVAPAPRGQLGLGAAYYASNDSSRNVASLFLKQAFVRLGAAAGQGGHAVRLGRFEFAEGNELAAADPTIAAVKATRVAQRLVGPFAWTHVGRAFDGAHYTFDRKARPAGTGRAAGPWNVTLAAFAPTEGAFRTSAWRPLDVYVGYAAYSRGLSWGYGGRGDLRVFALHYDDQRDATQFRAQLPATQRPTGDRRVRVETFGGHYVHLAPTAAGPIDLLAWGTVQTGRWGALDHQANAAALEAGWQPKGLPWKPWLRAMWFHGSGDANATDGEHNTFFEVLPTPRVYARFPIHNLMNLEQSAASLTLRPSAKLTLRSDVQSLRLAEASDLWYLGGGAFERTSFGYAGRPSGGRRAFATLTDLSADWRATRRVGLNAYLAHVDPRAVTRAVYPGTGPAWLGYVEFDFRY